MWNISALIAGALMGSAWLTSLYGGVFFRWYVTHSGGLATLESSAFLILFAFIWICVSLAVGLVGMTIVVHVFHSVCFAITRGGRGGRSIPRS